ncbi:2-amino-4-oxopentanoate thiolase subunit OrtB [Pelosinus baikalensis]|uniref:PLP-dependent lyase/thiolase n=1 Tax=Pelosinus baikalensis TaxID=2892015 RepID=A0ABS8HQX3_9FIRM|nr:2-amino-4-oxopentanoate thiolase subunit OrtB [Pelosinus baikalensis]MCC5465583.1 PLP-dependent lyase/thiolase [Pelosinus baikalensis]
MSNTSYQAVITRKPEIIKKATNIDYAAFESGEIGFDYERMMSQVAYSLNKIRQIQQETGVGNTPLLELKNITALARQLAGPGKGARIFIKDEACNPSGSFKARRASVSVYHAKQHGYKGVVAATSGNFGAAIASQAAMRGLKSIIVQEVFDSRGIGQPEILEKGRACEAYGAEVIQMTVGPELFYQFLLVLEQTGYFNASLYTPFSICGIETLGTEIAEQTLLATGRKPDAVVVTHAGGGNVTGTARGLQRAGCESSQIVAASVDLKGLHMASDIDFNRKSFTTGHTGFGMPFATSPDRADVPRNAARPLRYMDRYVTITQGEVFYVTEMLAMLEGLERGPAGNTSLTAAFVMAQHMERDEVIVVQETEYTGAGKHPSPQLSFAKKNGIEVRRGNPIENVPGKAIIIPEHPGQINIKDINLGRVRQSYLRNALGSVGTGALHPQDIEFLAAETRLEAAIVEKKVRELQANL